MIISNKEKRFILLGAVLVFLLLYYLLIIRPAFLKQSLLKRRISKAQQELDQIIKLSAEWEKFQKDRNRIKKIIAKRQKGFTLLSFLEKISREVGIHDKIQYMKPLSLTEQLGSSFKLVGMEIQLNGLNVDQLVRLLYKVEYSDELVSISRMKIQKHTTGSGASLSVTLQVETYVPAQQRVVLFYRSIKDPTSDSYEKMEKYYF